MGQERKILTAILFIIGLASLIRTVFLLWNSFLPDLSVLYDSTKILINNGNPYTSKDLYTQVNYPPTALLLLAPFLLTEFSVVSKIWLILSVLSFFITLFLFTKIKSVSNFVLSLLFLGTVFSFPFKFTLGMGQVNIILLFILSLSLYFILQNKNFFASLILGLTTAIKLFPVSLSLLFLFGKNKYFLITLGLALFFLSISFLFTYKINIYYFQNILFPLLTENSGSVYYNQSITGFFARLSVPQNANMIIRFFLLVISLFVAYKRRKNSFFIFSFLLTTVLLINNFSWQHHFILLLIPFYFFTSHLRDFKQVFVLLVSYLLIAFNFKNPDLLTHFWLSPLILSHGFLGLSILWLMFFIDPETSSG